MNLIAPDFNLETLIHHHETEMQRAFDADRLEDASFHCKAMADLIASRSDLVVTKMEREQGLK